VRWLAFRLMFLSGVVKLTSHDPTWRDWTALEYHYETQPLPTWTSWYVHQLPPSFHRASVLFMFYGELVVPFLIFTPRPVRLKAFVILILLQLLIAATGNYGFFNLLAIVLCLSLLDDRDWNWLQKLVRRSKASDTSPAGKTGVRWSWPRRVIVGSAAALIFTTTLAQTVESAWPEAIVPSELITLTEWLAPLRSTNHYGLFAVMTTKRPEIMLEGSDDGTHWMPYYFRWKPCELDRAPRFAPLHLPRLDWQMWFAALAGDCRGAPWILRFQQRLLEGEPAVLDLLRDCPFGERPPRYVRARLFLYTFTRSGSADWWAREDLGLYCPVLTLDQFEARRPSLDLE
jgi:lipase maturation factor 1